MRTLHRGEQLIPGNDLLSHPPARAVPSAVAGLTSVFGMGTGGTLLLWPPGNLFAFAPSALRRNLVSGVPASIAVRRASYAARRGNDAGSSQSIFSKNLSRHSREAATADEHSAIDSCLTTPHAHRAK